MRYAIYLLVPLLTTLAAYELMYTPHTKVYKSDGSVQCENTGIDLDVMGLELSNAGIDYTCAQKGNNGLVYAQICGGATGLINIYTLNTKNIEDIHALGFESVYTLVDYQDEVCKN